MAALLAVYAAECGSFVPPGTVAFSSPWLRRWKLAAPWTLLAGLGKAVVMGNPVPPLGTVLACRPPRGPARPSFRPADARRRAEDFARAVLPLRVACNVACLTLFVAAPVAYRVWGLVLSWPYLAGALLLSMWAVAFLFVRASRTLSPDGDPDRTMHAAVCALVPTTAMRACDLLAVPLLDGIHPLAAAAALCSKEDFTAYARLFRYDMARDPGSSPVGEPAPRPGSGLALSTAEGPGTAAWARPEWRDEIERFLDEAGAGPEVLARPPEKAEAGSKTYCPRCHAPYTVEQGTCRDCGGVALVPLPPAPTAG